MLNWLNQLFNSAAPDADLTAQILCALDDYDALLKGYLSHTQAQLWKAQYANLYAQCHELKKKQSYWSKADPAVARFLSTYRHIDTARHTHNHQWVASELKRQAHLFQGIEGKYKLDLQQQHAVVTDEDNNLVIAGAGSGKTMTIAAKIRYLTEARGVPPDKILLIAFTKMAGDQMRKRIKATTGNDFKVTTFHALGLDIIAQVQGSRPNIADISKQQAIPSEQAKVIESIIEQYKKDPKYLRLLQDYFAYYLTTYQPEDRFDTQGAYLLHLRDNHLALKTACQAPQSLQREVLKSMEEVEIANFLYLHNIEYRYEQAYEHATATTAYQQYKPDFYLPQYGIYIEHFALDSDGNCPKWFKPTYKNGKTYTYQDGVAWKRQLHRQYGTRLIETFSYEKQQGVLLEKLQEKLENYGVNCKQPKSAEEVWAGITRYQEKLVTRLEDLLYTFLQMFKCNNLTITDLYQRNARLNGYEHNRNCHFLRLFTPIYEAYAKELERRNEIDFNDMINHASQYIKQGYYTNPYNYIIIDEFQDISGAHADLVKALKTSRPSCKLFCVGDDWQSIYRFAGSDVSLFTNFAQHFGITEQLFIETTYRFDDSMIDLSRRFILKNPFQIPKQLRTPKGKKSTQTSYRIIYADHATDALSLILDDINQKISIANQPNPTCEILVLGRTRLDGSYEQLEKEGKGQFLVLEKNKLNTKRIESKKYPHFSIQITTAHSAKGMQADYVVILGCGDDKFDFPSQAQDDNVMQLVMQQNDFYPYGEERRLFYVAMTRAKQYTYFVSPKDRPSIFIREIAPFCPDDPAAQADTVVCPKCQTGRIVQRNTREKTFYGCTLYPYCDQTMTIDYYTKIKAKQLQT